jgi:hypothetical protein
MIIELGKVTEETKDSIYPKGGFDEGVYRFSL